MFVGLIFSKNVFEEKPRKIFCLMRYRENVYLDQRIVKFELKFIFIFQMLYDYIEKLTEI